MTTEDERLRHRRAQRAAYARKLRRARKDEPAYRKRELQRTKERYQAMRRDTKAWEAYKAYHRAYYKRRKQADPTYSRTKRT